MSTTNYLSVVCNAEARSVCNLAPHDCLFPFDDSTFDLAERDAQRVAERIKTAGYPVEIATGLPIPARGYRKVGAL